MKIKKSPNLNKSIDEASLLLLNKKSGDEEAAYRNFYQALCDTSPHGEMIQERGLTLEEIIKISRNLRNFGFGLEKYYYLPVYAFYRINSFKYILEHREELEKLKGDEAFTEAALGIKKYFNKIGDIIFNKGYYLYVPLGKNKH